MFRKSFLMLAICFTVVISFCSCTIPLRTVVHGPLDASGVPKGFDPERDVLLVAAMPGLDKPDLIDEKGTRKLNEEMQKHFPYRYKIVPEKEIIDLPEKFSDTSACRFALLIERQVIKQPGTFRAGPDEGVAFTPGYKTTCIDFAFYDRLTKQRFPHSGNGTSVMRIAVTNLTAWVKKAKPQSATAVAALSKNAR